MTCIRRWQ